ncbi:PLDc N-terminal domain-containing protein [Cellulomonas sp. SLBN-39]|uniref:PLDc N-terminal domain-containing protein n=1 Tax=Cellulomonas sp. SLBN-39 TaxID=2768446 RepID=UPI00114E9D7E|nr:PLDc N-terminal domain-containing protein [Cellulomonas sp. SLBN-39]TQL03292.1 phospholipase D-like protein [Cellulomonas sp. SLBN-39]
MRNLLFLLLLAFVVYCVVDVTRSDEDERLGAPHLAWIALVLLVPVVGGVVWLVVSRNRRAGRGGRGAPPRPVAPDDDPDFLWRLEQERRRQQRDATDDNPTT